MSGRRFILLLSILLLLLSSPVLARTWIVTPDGTGDAPTIAAAIDSAYWGGDIIELTDGIYTGEGNRDLTNQSKGIIIRSQSNNPSACILDCEGTAEDPHYGIRFYGDG